MNNLNGKQQEQSRDAKQEERTDESKTSTSSDNDAMYQLLLSRGLLGTAAQSADQPFNVADRHPFGGTQQQALPFLPGHQPQQQFHCQMPINAQSTLRHYPRLIPPLSTAPATTSNLASSPLVHQLLLLQQQQQRQQANFPVLPPAIDNPQTIIQQQQEQILRQQLLQQQATAASLGAIIQPQNPLARPAFTSTLFPINGATNPRLPSQAAASSALLGGVPNPYSHTNAIAAGHSTSVDLPQPSHLAVATTNQISAGQTSTGATAATARQQVAGSSARESSSLPPPAAAGTTTNQEPTPESGPASPSLSELPQIRLRVRSQMDETIRSIPLAEKAAYLEALQRAPAVVQRESDQLQFLRRCNYDLWAACKRLCAYWSERLKAFGTDRFCRPLTLTGDGALNEHDISQLHAGWPSILPAKTNEGKQALFFDRRKYIPNANGENRMRCVFYIFYILASQDTEATDFTAFSLVTHTGRFHEVDFGWVIKAFKIAINCMPLQVHWHLLNIPNPYKQHQYQKLMEWAADNVVKLFGDGEVHIEWEKGQLLKLMHGKLGMPKKAIPVVVGGEWRFEEFYDWCKKRAKTERKECKDLLLAASGDPPKSQTTASNVEAGVSAGPLTEEERKKKRRLADLIQSRRKRERQRLELNSLKAESSQLIHEHARLKEKNTQLSKAIEEANRILRDRGLGEYEDRKMGAS